MGKWITTSTAFTSFFSDRVGYKSGLALSRNEMVALLDKSDPLLNIIQNENEELVRIPTDQIEDSFQIILYRLGVTERPFIAHGPTLLQFEFINKAEQQVLFQQVLQHLGETHFDRGRTSIFDNFEEQLYFQEIKEKYGVMAYSISQRLVRLIKDSEEASPWDWLSARVTEWKYPIELKELFESESLNAMYGSFLDQRYINYLAENPEKLSSMHWRKFEALTAEYFERSGYRVEIGEGRNDGGVDIRIWSLVDDKSIAPVTLVQCKRTKSKIDKVLVKSLWADVVDENASGGVIVTTSSFSPGASQVCKARNYPIREANRDTVISWLKELKKTGRGVFMGE